MRVPSIASILLLVPITGCLSSEPADGTPIPSASATAAPYEAIRALLEGAPCKAPYTTKTTDNFRRVNLTTFDGPSGPQEIDIRGATLLAARAGGFTILNISDPRAPLEVGHYGEAGGMLDVKFSPDNDTALIASFNAIDVVDIRDPENPTRTSRWTFADAPQPPRGGSGQNAHMVYLTRIGSTDWVFLAPQSSTGVWILKLEGEPEARKLTYVTRTLPVQGGLSGPHDIFVQFDADLKKWVLYTADAFVGWTAHDVTDPTRPAALAVVPNADLSGTHSVQAAKIGNRRIVVTSTEFGQNALKVWDATDLSRPVQLGYWTKEVGPGWLDIQHNLNIVDGRLYMAHYTFGIYVFDLKPFATSTPANLLDLRPVAHYAHTQTAGPGGFWDVVVKDGVIYAGVYGGDHERGVHVIADACLVPGDPLLTSTG